MRVFISSVIRNFEIYRAAARKAVGLLQHEAIMCEDFGARSESSEVACMSEVDQADVVVVILGADFGFQTPTGESVTQQEFRVHGLVGRGYLPSFKMFPLKVTKKHSGGRYRTTSMDCSERLFPLSTSFRTPLFTR